MRDRMVVAVGQGVDLPGAAAVARHDPVVGVRAVARDRIDRAALVLVLLDQHREQIAGGMPRRRKLMAIVAPGGEGDAPLVGAVAVGDERVVVAVLLRPSEGDRLRRRVPLRADPAVAAEVGHPRRSATDDAASRRGAGTAALVSAAATSGISASAIAAATARAIRTRAGARARAAGDARRRCARVLELGDDDAFAFVAAAGDDLAPRIDDEAVAEGAPAVLVRAALRGGDDVALVLDRARAQQHFPVRGAGRVA